MGFHGLLHPLQHTDQSFCLWRFVFTSVPLSPSIQPLFGEIWQTAAWVKGGYVKASLWLPRNLCGHFCQEGGERLPVYEWKERRVEDTRVCCGVPEKMDVEMNEVKVFVFWKSWKERCSGERTVMCCPLLLQQIICLQMSMVCIGFPPDARPHRCDADGNDVCLRKNYVLITC